MSIDPLNQKQNPGQPEWNDTSEDDITSLESVIQRSLHLERFRRPGDLNNDGKVDMDDVLMMKDVLDGKIHLDEDELKYADINHDGIVDYKDLNLMINLVLESNKAEEKVTELQSVYDEVKKKEEKGSSISNLDKVQINSAKADLEQAIADLILKRHEE